MLAVSEKIGLICALYEVGFMSDKYEPKLNLHDNF
jgi:hypothetical protein